MKNIQIIAALGLCVAIAAHAQAAPASADKSASSASSANAANAANAASAALAVSSALTTEGVVRKIDKAQGKLTVRHGPIPNLDMPAMTMVFRVVDVKMLDALKEGDKVKFAADKVNGAITVTAIEALR